MAQTRMRFGGLHAALMTLVALVACSPDGGSQDAADTTAFEYIAGRIASGSPPE